MSSSDSSGHRRHRKKHRQHHRHRRSRSRESSQLTSLFSSLHKDIADSHASVRKELQSISDRVTAMEEQSLPARSTQTTDNVEQSSPSMNSLGTAASLRSRVSQPARLQPLRHSLTQNKASASCHQLTNTNRGATIQRTSY